jgi:hypothetical protein
MVYEVRHPDLVMAGLSSVVIGYPSEQEPRLYSRWDAVSLRHIVRLEPEESGQPTAPPDGAGQ